MRWQWQLQLAKEGLQTRVQVGLDYLRLHGYVYYMLWTAVCAGEALMSLLALARPSNWLCMLLSADGASISGVSSEDACFLF